MNIKQYKFYRILISFILAITISFSLLINNVIVAIAAILIAMFLLFNLKKQVKDVLYDERDLKNMGKALRISTSIFCILGAFGSLILMWGFKEDSLYYNIGLTLSFSVVFLLLTYSVFYIYYNKKGNEK